MQFCRQVPQWRKEKYWRKRGAYKQEDRKLENHSRSNGIEIRETGKEALKRAVLQVTSQQSSLTLHSCSWHGIVTARLTSEQPSNVVPLKNIYVVASTFIAAVTVDSSETEVLGGVQFFATSPPHQLTSNVVTTRNPSTGQLETPSHSRTLGGVFPHFFREQKFCNLLRETDHSF